MTDRDGHRDGVALTVGSKSWISSWCQLVPFGLGLRYSESRDCSLTRILVVEPGRGRKHFTRETTTMERMPDDARNSISNATSATGRSMAYSVAHSIRSLAEFTRHMRERQDERGISNDLVRETVMDGIVTDQRNSRLLHVSDHIIVVSEDRDRQRVGITTFVHPLLDVWHADSLTSQNSQIHSLDTAYFFFQVLPLRFLTFCCS